MGKIRTQFSSSPRVRVIAYWKFPDQELEGSESPPQPGQWALPFLIRDRALLSLTVSCASSLAFPHSGL